MKLRLGVVLVGVVLVACADDEVTGTGSGGCADITGNWNVKSETVTDTCPPGTGSGSAAGTNVTIQRQGDGSYIVQFPGVTGGCPGSLDAASCKFISTCEVTSEGTRVLAGNIEWTFAGRTLSGTEILRAFPPAVPNSCEGSYRDTGSKL